MREFKVLSIYICSFLVVGILCYVVLERNEGKQHPRYNSFVPITIYRPPGS